MVVIDEAVITQGECDTLERAMYERQEMMNLVNALGCKLRFVRMGQKEFADRIAERYVEANVYFRLVWKDILTAHFGGRYIDEQGTKWECVFSTRKVIISK